MALSEQKRQQKIRRRKAKEKKRALAQREKQQAATSPAALNDAPILDCCTTDSLWEVGIAQVLLARRLPDGQVAVGGFLVDRYCLGVKDALWRVMSPDEYRREVLGRLASGGRRVDLSPEFARKIVEGAVQYARDLGFSPHRDFHKAKKVFGRIDAEASDEEIEFGQDGRPTYIRGPHESEQRIQQILDTLESSCGEGNFDFIIRVD